MNKPVTVITTIMISIGLLAGQSFSFQRQRNEMQEPEEVVVDRPAAVAEIDLSVMLFDIRVDQLSRQIQAAGFSDEMFREMDSPIPGVRDIRKIKRAFGSFSLPESIETLMRANVDAPMKFFIRVEFVDEETVAVAEERLLRRIEKVLVVDGKRYTALPPRIFGVEGVVYHRVNPTTVEVGTLNYCARESRRFFTPRLLEAYGRTPDAPVRFAADLKTKAVFVGELIEQTREFIVRDFESVINIDPFLDLYDDGEMLYGAVDMSGPAMFNATLVARNETGAEDIRGAADAFLGLTKMIGEEEVKRSFGRDYVDKIWPVYKDFSTNTSVVREGVEVTLNVPRPVELDAMIAQAADMQRQQAIRSTQRETAGHLRSSSSAVMTFVSMYGVYPFDYSGDDIGHRIESTQLPAINQELSWRAKVVFHLNSNRSTRTEIGIRRRMSNFSIEATKGPDEMPNSQFADKMPFEFGLVSQNVAKEMAPLEAADSGNMELEQVDVDFNDPGLLNREVEMPDREQRESANVIVSDEPIRSGPESNTLTHALGFISPGLSKVVWIETDPHVKRAEDVTDGLENTIMLIEYPNGKPWLNNDPISIDEAVAMVTSLGPDEGLAVAFYNGMTTTIRNNADPELIRRMFVPDDDPQSAADVRQTVFPEVRLSNAKKRE